VEESIDRHIGCVFLRTFSPEKPYVPPTSLWGGADEDSLQLTALSGSNSPGSTAKVAYHKDQRYARGKSHEYQRENHCQ
jgi:hypothetical protein